MPNTLLPKPTKALLIPDEPTKRTCRKCNQTIMFRYSGIGRLSGQAVICGYKYCACGDRPASKHQQHLQNIVTHYRTLNQILTTTEKS